MKKHLSHSTKNLRRKHGKGTHAGGKKHAGKKHPKAHHAPASSRLHKVKTIHAPIHSYVPPHQVIYAGAVCPSCGYCHVLLKSLPSCPMCEVCSGCDRKIMHCSCKEGE